LFLAHFNKKANKQQKSATLPDFRGVSRFSSLLAVKGSLFQYSRPKCG